MDISGGISVTALAANPNFVADSIGVSVLRKALDTQAQGALALIQAIPQPTPTQSLPDNLGKNLNVVA